MTRALHLAFLISNLKGGGAERATLNLAQALLERGHRVDILLTLDATIQYPVPDGARLFLAATDNIAAPETPPTAATAHGGNHPPNGRLLPLPDRDLASRNNLHDWFRLFRSIHPRGWRPAYQFLHIPGRMRTMRAIARYMEEARPDCLFASLPNAKINALLARRLLPRPPPVVPVLRNLMHFRGGFAPKLYPYLLPDTPLIVAVSEAAADSLRAVVPRVADRIVAIHNPTRLDDIEARMVAPPLHPWLEEDAAPVLLAAGKLAGQKDFPLLLRAFARVARLRDCRLLILGEGPDRPELEALVRELKLTGRVALPGWVKNPWAAMARASMFVLSSRWEGLPNVLIEALACGCPVVSTDAGGAREILNGSRYGALVPVGDETELADAILRTAEEEEQATPEQRRRKRRERRERARMFSTERAVDEYLNLLAEVLPGASPPEE